MKWPGDKNQSYIKIDKLPKKCSGSYSDSDGNNFMTICAFECRGIEIVGYQPGADFIAYGTSSDPDSKGKCYYYYYYYYHYTVFINISIIYEFYMYLIINENNEFQYYYYYCTHHYHDHYYYHYRYTFSRSWFEW